MNCWVYKGECLENPLEGYYGFTYIITDRKNNRIYVGKKAFSHNSKKKLSKKAKKLPENKGKRILKTTKDSGWKDYWGSSKELLEQVKTLGKENFTREILEFASNKSDLSLKEVEAQIKFKVLRIDSYNHWISCKIYKKHLKV